MPHLFSDPAWTWPTFIRQRMADDIRDFGKILPITRIIQEDWMLELGEVEYQEYLKGF